MSGIKPPERLEWERAWDGMVKMREWILENALASEEELAEMENEAKAASARKQEQSLGSLPGTHSEQVIKAADLINNMAGQLPQQA